MGRYIIKRLLLILPTLFIILLVNFVILQSVPGGPVEQKLAQIEQINRTDATKQKQLSQSQSTISHIKYKGSQGLSPEMIASLEQQYGFDKPAYSRFMLMVKQYVRLDFGQSFFKGEKVTDLILQKMPVSISLGFWSIFIIYLIAIPLGISKAINHGSRIDTTTTILLSVAHSVPIFVFGIILLVLFAGGSYWQIFPLQGLTSDNFQQLSLFAKIKDYFWHLTLPIIASTVTGFATLSFLTKFSFMNELSKQYVLFARSTGLKSHQVLYGHVFRNAMLVIIAGIPSAIVGIFFASNFIIEIIFNLDGLGMLGFEAVQQRDYPVIFGTLFLFTLVGLILQLVSDVCYHLIDPRIDYESQ